MGVNSTLSKIFDTQRLHGSQAILVIQKLFPVILIRVIFFNGFHFLGQNRQIRYKNDFFKKRQPLVNILFLTFPDFTRSVSPSLITEKPYNSTVLFNVNVTISLPGNKEQSCFSRSVELFSKKSKPVRHLWLLSYRHSGRYRHRACSVPLPNWFLADIGFWHSRYLASLTD